MLTVILDQVSDAAVGGLLLIIYSICVFAFRIFVSLGAINYGLKLLRTGRAEVGDIFACGGGIISGLCITFVQGLLAITVFVLCLVPAGLMAMADMQGEPVLFAGICGVVIGGVAGVMVWLRYYIAIVFVVDRKMGALEAMKVSTACMAGNRLPTFFAGLVAGIAGAVLMLLTCFVGSVIVLPLFHFLPVVAYVLATGQVNAARASQA